LGNCQKRRYRQNKGCGLRDLHTKAPGILYLALCSFGVRLAIEKTLKFPIQRIVFAGDIE
jgi:hypothetical protein